MRSGPLPSKSVAFCVCVAKTTKAEDGKVTVDDEEESKQKQLSKPHQAQVLQEQAGHMARLPLGSTGELLRSFVPS